MHARVAAIDLCHLYSLGMAGVSTADILIGGVLDMALGIANFSGHHTRNALEHELRSPEAAGAKSSLLQVGRLRILTAKSHAPPQLWHVAQAVLKQCSKSTTTT